MYVSEAAKFLLHQTISSLTTKNTESTQMVALCWIILVHKHPLQPEGWAMAYMYNVYYSTCSLMPSSKVIHTHMKEFCTNQFSVTYRSALAFYIYN